MPVRSIALPRPARLARLAGWTAGLTVAAAAAWFAWFDTWFALGHALGALTALSDGAARLERKGDLAEAEALLRESLAIQDRRVVRFAAGGDPQMQLDTQSQLAFVVLKLGRRAEAEEIHRLVASRAAQLDGDAYERYDRARLTSRHGRLLLELGEAAEAQQTLEAASDLYRELLGDADPYLRGFVERGLQANEELRAGLGWGSPPGAATN